ncbi:kinase-like protein [Lactarius akahatsu]|uniref:cyclin-dependent kinase n=1 Tax=Lactarius akahatsu TaxID=416441 RepID=A0AAD4LIC2_9AGAM|nr:kinase-like protein [Lactarius akahatsu]
MQPPSRADFPFHRDPVSLIAETLVSVVTKAVITLDDGEQRLVAIKVGKARKGLVLEPHDIVKELRLLSSLSHPAIISVLGHKYDAPLSSQRFWMPFMPFTLSDLLSIPTFSPIPNPDALRSTRNEELAFEVVAKSIVYQILSGVAYLHSQERQIAHRDIKPRNILLDTSGSAVLIDFGCCPEEKMYFEVGSGPYRAPELLFGARKYDAMACDLWSLGATFAEFFTTLHRRATSDGLDDDNEERGDPTNAYLSDELPWAFSPSQWERYSLFDGSRGDIGLAWSIFRIRGSPTPETWPTFSDLPDANKVNFVDSPGVHLSTLLPHLGVPSPQGPPVHRPPAEQESTAVDLLQRFLVYAPASRFSAQGALRHPWLLGDGPLVLPRVALATVSAAESVAEMRDSRTAAEWFKVFFVSGSPRTEQGT